MIGLAILFLVLSLMLQVWFSVAGLVIGLCLAWALRRFVAFLSKYAIFH
jgi:ABC-type lipoprotein release transport system permease subunit